MKATDERRDGPTISDQTISDQEEPMPARVTMYTTRRCGDCTITKNFLDKFGIPFEEIDIENDPQAAEFVMRVNDGRRSVPTLVVDGDAVSLSGFSRRKFDAFVAKHDLRTVADHAERSEGSQN